MPTTTYDGVTVSTQANVYFDGKCVSHGIVLADGTKKSVGVILPDLFGEFFTPLPCQFLVRHDPLGEQMGRDRHAEKTDADDPGKGKVGEIGVLGQHPVPLFEKHRHRGYGSVEQGLAPLAHEAGPRQHHQNHVTEAAAAASADIHQQGQRNHIHHHFRGQQPVETRTPAGGPNKERDGSGQIGATGP